MNDITTVLKTNRHKIVYKMCFDNVMKVTIFN